MNSCFNMLMVGVGGQGIVLASDIAAGAALKAGYDVKKSEIHGMSQRGGSVFSHIRLGEKVFSPVIPERQADLLVSLEEMEVLRWIGYAGKSSRIILSRERITPANCPVYPEGTAEFIKSAFSKADILEKELLVEMAGKPKFINSVILGVSSVYTPVEEGCWVRAIEELVPAGSAGQNLAAFRNGRALIKER